MKKFTLFLISAAAAGLSAGCSAETVVGEPEQFYQHSGWQSRVTLPTKDALNNFWPESPKVNVDYSDKGLDRVRLGKVPPPGVHPRVYLTPDTAEVIRKNIALGDKAPAAFRNIWGRCGKDKNARNAYLLQDNELGKKLAAEFMVKVGKIAKTVEAMNRYPDRDNIFSLEKSMAYAGDVAGQNGVFGLLDYDYLYQWLTPEQRAETEKVIAAAIKDRIGNFMSVPDHFMINNHQCFGMEYLALMLLIEGQPGFQKEIYDLAVRKMTALLDYYITPNGMCYETIKGWLPMSVFVPLFRRHPELANHSNLHAKMRFYAMWLRGENGKWKVREEMRDSAFQVIWMMHYLFPENPVYDMLYSSTFDTNAVLINPKFRWSSPVGANWENLLLSAQERSPIDYTKKENMEKLNLPLFWSDPQRGYYSGRSGWDVNDIYLNMAGKQDMVYCGHEGPEQGRWAMWADGVNWIFDKDLLFNKNAIFQNMISIDGKSIRWAPVSSTWLGADGNKDADLAAVDYKDAYTYRKMNRHPLNFPSLRGTYWEMFGQGNVYESRDYQLQYHPSAVKFFDGFAHTDYGLWNGEQRLLENYHLHNPMERAYRTLVLARGEKPYVLVLDDLKKDDNRHLYRWNAALPDDVILLSASNPGHNGMEGQPGKIVSGDLILGKADTPRNPNRIYFYQPIFNPRRGAPQLLVRTLYRATDYGYPMPSVERVDIHTVLNIPAFTTEGEFKVLLFPHRAGDRLPETKWNEDRSRLEVKIGKNTDIWHFGKTDGGRTVFALERDGKIVQSSNAAPAAPAFSANGVKFDISADRYTRYEGRIPEYRFVDSIHVNLSHPEAPAAVRYTLDNTEPTEKSPVYHGGIEVKDSAVLKAKAFDPNWKCGEKSSRTLTVKLIKTAPLPADKSIAATIPGVRTRVYEISVNIYDEKGFFHAGKIMFPNLDKYTPVLDGTIDGVKIPHSVPAAPQIDQYQGFYRFDGMMDIPETGLYRFAVSSNGPMELKIDGRTVIAEKGVYHLNWKKRSGEIALEKGKHRFALTVCDPVYWKLNTDGVMPLEFAYAFNGGAEQVFALPLTRDKNPAGAVLSANAPIPVPQQAEVKMALERGVEMNRYSRPGMMDLNCIVKAELLDLDNITPRQSTRVEKFNANDSNSSLVEYTGLFYAPADGIYTFETPAREEESIDYNQLTIGGKVISQHGVPGRMPGDRVELKKGYYLLKFRLGKSRCDLMVTYPDGEKQQLSALDLYRPALPVFCREGEKNGASAFEIYGKENFTIELPAELEAKIYYTLDNTDPSASSMLYNGPISFDKNATVKAAGFVNGKRVTEIATAQINRVESPQQGLMVQTSFKEKKADRSIPAEVSDGTKVWGAFESSITPEGLRVGASAGVGGALDVNIDKSKNGIGMVVGNLVFDRSAMSVAMRLKMDKPQGKLFGKWGFNAIGKGYTTVRAEVNNGNVRVDARPSRINGNTKMKPGVWHTLIYTCDTDKSALYLDGRKIGEGGGSPTLATESLDCLIDLSGVISDLRVYSRALTPFEAEKLHSYLTEKAASTPESRKK